MEILELIGGIAEFFSGLFELSAPESKKREKEQPGKKIVPVDKLINLLLEDKKLQAVAHLQVFMNWDIVKANKYIDELEKSLKAPHEKPETNIETAIREHQQAERSAGGTLGTYLFRSVSKKR